MTKAEWLLKCGWIVDDAAGVVIHVWSLPSWSMMAEGDTPGVKLDAAIRIQTAVIETESREIYRLVFAACQSSPEHFDIGDSMRRAKMAAHAYVADHTLVFTDEATK